MLHKFHRYVPKGVSRKGLKKLQDSSSNEVVVEEIVSTDNYTQTESPEKKDISVGPEEPTVMTSDASTQTDEMFDTKATITDELTELPEQDHLCEGNNDTKFHPLIV